MICIAFFLYITKTFNIITGVCRLFRSPVYPFSSSYFNIICVSGHVEFTISCILQYQQTAFPLSAISMFMASRFTLSLREFGVILFRSVFSILCWQGPQQKAARHAQGHMGKVNILKKYSLLCWSIRSLIPLFSSRPGNSFFFFFKDG